MLGIKPIKYRLDVTGTSPNNRVIREPRHIGVADEIRIIVPRCGAFFTDSLKMYDAYTHEPLFENRDYKCLHLDSEAYKKSGKPVAYMIAITNPSVNTDVYYDMQAYGGMGVYLIPLLNQLIPLLQSEDRIQLWNRIADKPTAFNPGKHYHDVGDFYGFEFLVLSLLRISDMIIGNDIDDHTEIQAMINILDAEFRRRWQSFVDSLNQHIEDISKPHGETAEQLDIYTTTDISIKLQQKLGVRGTAIDSLKLFGKTFQELITFIQRDYDASKFGSGVFPKERFGEVINQGTIPLAGMVFTNKKQFVNVSTIVESQGPIYVGYSTEANVRAAFADYPIGTTVNWVSSSSQLYISYHIKKTGPGEWKHV